MNSKSLLQSKTFWIAFLQALAGIAIVFASHYPTVGWIVVVKSVVDIIVRTLTTQPIG